MVRRHELTDAQRERMRPLLPPQRPATGRPVRSYLRRRGIGAVMPRRRIESRGTPI